MTALNFSKLSFCILLLSIAFAQILVVSAAENVDSDDTSEVYVAFAQILAVGAAEADTVDSGDEDSIGRCNPQSHCKTTHLKHHRDTSAKINMTVLNFSKLSFCILLLSIAFAQILVVSAAENVDSDDGDTVHREWVLAMMWSRTDELLAWYPY
ncbi:uncharacterized protein EDB93DRAFT_1336037 [Suillus bovinus]|uniref:uncharacterized protein n=1 Tax=Suillus bovinus TaxID=48563 RepID=UPI001B866248|nr:uncharacterized protein EDB93DRAFT_1336037 [Suillus bovinus]KAG2154462.1 hypothetical protein EDB93DRAFT_1336037 [Suillus bovinus]